jgi:pimeloyl-ACP methyl ester carboxylesterase
MLGRVPDPDDLDCHSFGPIGMSDRMIRAILAISFLAGCSDGDDGELDASVADSGDSGFSVDVGPKADAQIREDASTGDAGFADPYTLRLGNEEIAGARTFVHVRGTLTSTMPPVLVLPTGPQMGGVPGFFGQFGGGIGHEYFPEHLDFLLPGRLLVFYDYAATGRSGFGAVGSATISVDAHVTQVGDVLDWLQATVGVDSSPADILGHGYGGGIGSLYAARNPARIGRLVLVTPMGADVRQYATTIAELQARLSSADRQRLDTLTREPECIGDLSMCTVEIFRVLAPRMGCPNNEARINTLEFLYGELRAFDFLREDLQEDRYDWRDELVLIQAETTVISGACDPTPPDAALTYTSSIAGAAHHVLTGAGHWPMVEDNVEFQRRVRTALTYP